MTKKNINLVGFFLVPIVVFLLTLRFGQTFSPNTLYLTQPINAITGVVSKIEGKEITIVITTHNNSSSEPTANLSYVAVITGTTAFVRPPVSIPFLFITPIPVKERKWSLKDISVGNTVTISTLSDLRLLKSTVFEADNIYLSAAVNILTGNIVDIKNDTLLIKSSDKKSYEVGLTAQTEISGYLVTAPKPGEPAQPIRSEKYTLKDLKKNMLVTIYTAEDILTDKSPTALRIEPILTPQ